MVYLDLEVSERTIVVRTAVARRPAQIRTCRIAAYGSYLNYVASNRKFGCGCRIFALGIHRSTNGLSRSQVIDLADSALAQAVCVAKLDTILDCYRKLIAHKVDGFKCRA